MENVVLDIEVSHTSDSSPTLSSQGVVNDVALSQPVLHEETVNVNNANVSTLDNTLESGPLEPLGFQSFVVIPDEIGFGEYSLNGRMEEESPVGDYCLDFVDLAGPKVSYKVTTHQDIRWME